MPTELTAEQFIKKLYTYCLPEERKNSKQNIKAKDAEEFLGVPLATVFSLAKEFTFMLTAGIEKFLESLIYEVKVGGVSIMNWRARSNYATYNAALCH